MSLTAAPDLTTSATQRAQSRDARRAIIATTGPTFALSFLQFTMPVLAASLMTSLDSPPEAYGVIAAVMASGCVALYLVSGALLPAIGPVALTQLALALNIIGIAAVLLGNWPSVLIGAFVIGFGFAAVTPASSQLIADFVPKTRWATAMSLRVTAIPIGGIAAGTFGTLLVVAGGWRAVLATASLLMGVFGLALLRIPRRFNERQPRSPLAVSAMFRWETLVRPFALVRATPRLQQIMAAGSCFSVLQGMLAGFLVTYLTSVHKLSLDKAGLLFAIVQGMGIIGRFGLGPVADRLGSSVPILLVLAPIAFGGMLLLAAFDPTWPFWLQALVTAIAGFGASTFTGLYLAEVARRAPRTSVGLATSASGLVSFSTYAITPLVFASIASLAGWPVAFATLGAAGALAVFILAMPVPAVDTVLAPDVFVPTRLDQVSMAQSAPRPQGHALERWTLMRSTPRHLKGFTARQRRNAAQLAADLPATAVKVSHAALSPNADHGPWPPTSTKH